MLKSCIGLCTLAIISISVLSCNSHLSDAQIANEFEKNRSDFERLASMAVEDRVTSVYRNGVVLLSGFKLWNEGDEGFSSQRFDEYRKLFDKNNILSVSHDKGVVEICCASVSVTDSDIQYERFVSSRGYSFSMNELQPQVKSLDDLEVYQSGPYYRKIDNNWYLFQETGISKPE